MLMLTATTDSIAVTTSNGAAYDLDIVSTFIDRVTSTGAIGAAQRELENITSATTVDIVEEPGADTTRKVKYINIRNAHATSAVDVIVQLDANGTFYEMYKVTLLAGESLVYTEKVGFFKVLDIPPFERSMILTANSVHATAATWATVGTLNCAIRANRRYCVFAALHHQNNASTTGAQFGFNVSTGTPTARFGIISSLAPNAAAAAFATGTATAQDTSFGGAVASGATTPNTSIIAGHIQNTADATLNLRATSEITVANGLTVLEGSWMRVFRPRG